MSAVRKRSGGPLGTEGEPLRFYNALGRAKQVFEPLEPGCVRIYSCGPTVYSHQHLGNMRPYVFADVLKRTLRLFGYPVRHVVNITDVGHLTDDADAGEDKMELAARQRGESVWDVAERWTRVFMQDIAKLGVESPDVWAKATQHIDEQIDMIRRLETNGFTYKTADGIYFDTSRAPNYGELVGGIDFEAQKSQERIEGVSDKRSPADFALWKFSPEEGPRRQMEWDSPWGRGFPGWHLECSAMSEKHLGVPFDIHTGGVDHIPVHHTNEIVQTEHATGTRPCVRFWMHNGWLMMGGAKMAKSAGGTLSLDTLGERGIDPLAYRYFLLGAHYRQQLSLTDEAVDSAQVAYRRLLRHAAAVRQEPGSSAQASADAAESEERVKELRLRFRDALADDLNTPQALAVVWEVARAQDLAACDKATLFAEADAVLGLGLADAVPEESECDPRIDALVRERDSARGARDFARADAIRDELAAEGIVIEDGPEGSRWRRG